MTPRHTIVALVEDRPGVLNRVSSLFRRRGFYISSLAVGKSEQPHLSRMTFVVEGDEDTVEQVTKQLNKLIEVIRVSELNEEDIVVRELALIKVHASATTRSEIMQLVAIFRANIVDVGPQSLIIEATGEEDKINALYNLLRPFGVRELMRTGRIAMSRGTLEGRGERGAVQTNGASGGDRS
ncbi:MAG: acetolactate synthase small subunit [Dehalococcoidia bacterium]|nr:acetolactate synthase small subunit [Dehalococcoidia bacterium]